MGIADNKLWKKQLFDICVYSKNNGYMLVKNKGISILAAILSYSAVKVSGFQTLSAQREENNKH